MKLYISGKITGCEDYLIKFINAEKYLHDMGYSVINPAKVNFMLPLDTTYDEYMRMSFTMLDMAEGIYLLKDWQDSNGARLEKERAENIGLPVYYEGEI